MILEVELEVGVLLDGAEDLQYVVSIARERSHSFKTHLDTLCGDLVGQNC